MYGMIARRSLTGLQTWVRYLSVAVPALIVVTACGGGGGGGASAGADGGVLDDGGTEVVSDAPSACDAIAPAPGNSGEVNSATLQHCLDTEHHATLLAGEFLLAHSVKLPASATLRGAANHATLLRAVGPTWDANFVVRFGVNSPASAPATIASVRIDAANVLAGKSNASIVHFAANGHLEDSELFNAGGAARGNHAAAAFLLCGGCDGARLTRVDLHDSFYGVIFGPGGTAQIHPVVEHSHVHETRCDAFTYMSFGEATDNLIEKVGFDCENGPIPGAALYSLGQAAGGIFSRNTVHDTCGNGLDLDRVQNFTIEANNIVTPGSPFDGHTYCLGSGAFLLDVGHSTIRGNMIGNTNPHNAGFDPNQVMHARGAANFSDLPAGGNTIVAFVLGQRPDGSGLAVGNVIENNTLRATCAAPCVGMGYFASRDTGYAAGGAWGASTTNYYRGNTPVGSNIGSMRCGGNWYAAGSSCLAGSPAPCNVDDSQHPTTNYRNDTCSHY
jgi:hypothetical protein